jgi:Holliday junction DNA helicase RuvA
MISFIKGVIVDIEEDKVVVECNNIGYNIFVPSSVINKAGNIGSNIKLHTYLSVREDAMTLFGFLTKEELKLFKQMIGVSGIGPKGALGILSTLSVESLRLAIVAGDSKAISKSPGIGAKTASKLILELKDKIDISTGIDDEEADIIANNIDTDIQGDAVDALIVLGYSASQSFAAVKEACKNNNDVTDVSDLIKIALKNI